MMNDEDYKDFVRPVSDSDISSFVPYNDYGDNRIFPAYAFVSDPAQLFLWISQDIGFRLMAQIGAP